MLSKAFISPSFESFKSPKEEEYIGDGDDDSPLFIPSAKRFIKRIRRQFRRTVSPAPEEDSLKEKKSKKKKSKKKKPEENEEEDEGEEEDEEITDSDEEEEKVDKNKGKKVEEEEKEGKKEPEEPAVWFPITRKVIGMVAEQVNEDLKYYLEDIEVRKKELEEDGMLLENMTEYVKEDEEAVLIAVKNNGLALQFSGTNYRNNRKLVMEAIQNNPLSYEFAGKALQADEDIALLALGSKHRKRVLKLLHPKLAKDKDFIYRLLIVVYESGDGESFFPHIHRELREDRNFVIRLLKGNPLIFKYIPEEERSDYEYAMVAVEGNAMLIEDVGRDILDKDPKFKFILQALSKNIEVREFMYRLGKLYDTFTKRIQADEVLKTKYSHSMVAGCSAGLAECAEARKRRKHIGKKETKDNDILDIEFKMQNWYTHRGWSYTYLKNWRSSVEDFIMASCLNKKFRHPTKDFLRFRRRMVKCIKEYLVREFDKDWTKYKYIRETNMLSSKKSEKELIESLTNLFLQDKFREHLFDIFIEEPFLESRQRGSNTALKEFELELYEGGDVVMDFEDEDIGDGFVPVKDPLLELRSKFKELCVPFGTKPPYNQPMISLLYEKNSPVAYLGRFNDYNSRKPRNGYYVQMNVIKGGLLSKTKFSRIFVGKFGITGNRSGDGIEFDPKDPNKVRLEGVWKNGKLVEKKE